MVTALTRKVDGFERLVEDKFPSQGTGQPHVTPPNTQNTGGSTGPHTEHVHVSSESTKEISYKKFRTSGATNFKGEIDPIVAIEWIKNCERTFLLIHCKEEDKVNYATAMLLEAARDWWDGIYEAMTPEQRHSLNWTSFREKFYSRFCPTDIQERYASDFASLQQGSLSVAAYLSEFNRKVKFVPKYVTDEAEKVKKFITGLHIDIREHLDGMRLCSVEEAAEQARRREYILSIKNAQQMPPPKRAHTEPNLYQPTSSGQSFSRNFSRQQKKGGGKYCHRCRRRHRGACFDVGRTGSSSTGASSFRSATPTSIVCHRCNEPGHIAPMCPNRNILICFECGGTGHVRRDCPRLVGSTASVARPVTTTVPSTALPAARTAPTTSGARP